MRGFLGGTLALVILSVLVQKGTADKITTGTGILAGLARRALSSNVAGIPARATASTTGSSGSSAAPATATTNTPVPTTGQLTLV